MYITVERPTAADASTVAVGLVPPMSIRPPMAVVPEMALVTDIRGVCSECATPQTACIEYVCYN